MSIAREVASRGINVIGLAPGMVETPSTQETLKANRAHYESRIPLGRIAKPEEIASVAVFLMSDRASYITGATIDISGGILMR
jgi:3-oxoacyl-[acyl-carrier protein] reductase